MPRTPSRLALIGDDPLGPVDQDADGIREAACKLVRPDSFCAPSQPSPAEPSGGSGGGALAALAELIMWLLFFALVAALVYLAVRVAVNAVGRSRRSKPAGDDSTFDDVEELPRVVVDRRREPSDWRREADEHRRAGRFRDALRCQYRALVGDLARRGLVDEIPGRTSGEERAQMAVVAPRAAVAFAAAAELFDEAWYGGVRVGAADVAQMETLENDVLAGAGAATR